MFLQAVYVCVMLILHRFISSQLLETCRLIRSTSDIPVLTRDGDIVIGGLFSLHDSVLETNHTFTSELNPSQCLGFNFRTFRWMQTMIFAIEEINRDNRLLPNKTLGYTIYDSCGTHFHSLRTVFALMSQDGTDGLKCRGKVPVVIGDGGSTLSLVVARFLGVFRVPQISYFSSCACLSDKVDFPAFMRTIPSDFFQVDALAQLVKHFGWSWIGIVAGDDAYGRGGSQTFNDQILRLDACVAFYEVIPKNHDTVEIGRIVKRIGESGARVVLVFALEQDARALFSEALYQDLTGIQWLASEAWITSAVLSTPEIYPVLQGSVGYAIHRAEIPGLQPFLLRLHPSKFPHDPFVSQFWEEMFKCSLGKGNPSSSLRRRCSGVEVLANTTSIYSDVSQLRISYNVYKAVYAIAHALDSMMSCEPGNGPFVGESCSDLSSIQPWQLLHYLKHVNFTDKFGEQTKFDDNGDPSAIYDLINWQLKENGEVHYATVGKFDQSMRPNLVIEEKDIIWNGNQRQVPTSVCSISCPPGTRKAIKSNVPLCCYDCISCPPGEISNGTDAVECERCLPEFWSNTRRDACIPKLVEFLSFSDTMGVTLACLSLLGCCFTLTITLIFACKRHTPLIRANNSELSFLILSSLWLCFLCALVFIGRPTWWSCGLRHTAFGIAFSLCLSCILGKTMVVLMAFRSALPGNNVMRWFGPFQQRGIIFLCTAVQVVICVTWLCVAPPVPRAFLTQETSRIVLLCDVGSTLAFSLVLGYIGLLAAVCFLLAYFARKLPDNFNEAKFITFSMLIFCAVWIAFVPAYVSSPGKYTVAVEIFAILASSYGLLLCIFSPKCYVILWRPEKNTKRYLLSRFVSDGNI